MVKKGQLNEFLACHLSPAPGQTLCALHMKASPPETLEDRLDKGMMTQGRKKKLGLEEQVLTSKKGCRKQDAITVRQTRAKTAGMMYLIRPCGITLGHLEMIIGGT